MRCLNTIVERVAIREMKVQNGWKRLQCFILSPPEVDRLLLFGGQIVWHHAGCRLRTNGLGMEDLKCNINGK
jgi:hypothetical protein